MLEKACDNPTIRWSENVEIESFPRTYVATAASGRNGGFLNFHGFVRLFFSLEFVVSEVTMTINHHLDNVEVYGDLMLRICPSASANVEIMHFLAPVNPWIPESVRCLTTMRKHLGRVMFHKPACHPASTDYLVVQSHSAYMRE